MVCFTRNIAKNTAHFLTKKNYLAKNLFRLLFRKCQINTDPMKSALGYLAVVVPPDIIDYRTSHDMTIDEGQNITLKCTADGLPEPTIEVN